MTTNGPVGNMSTLSKNWVPEGPDIVYDLGLDAKLGFANAVYDINLGFTKLVALKDIVTFDAVVFVKTTVVNFPLVLFDPVKVRFALKPVMFLLVVASKSRLVVEVNAWSVYALKFTPPPPPPELPLAAAVILPCW